jgi:hypothetical protein
LEAIIEKHYLCNPNEKRGKRRRGSGKKGERESEDAGAK